MTTSIRLGRIAGVEIGVNWSWLVVFGLIVWSLSRGVFPQTDPHLSSGTYTAMAIVAALSFFASLLLHELGHAVQARREGIAIDGITLWLFGGVAKLRGRIPSAGAEFRVAIAGPLVSLALGILFAVLAYVLALPPAVDGVVSWLGYTNLILLAFNLIPALPLDGGRVLRSALWRRRGSLESATELAARIGRGFGALFVVGGIALLLLQGAYSGLWLAFIGIFLRQAAAAEARAVRNLAPDLTIGRVVDDVAHRQPLTGWPLVVDGRVLGLLSFRPAGGPVPQDGPPRVALDEPVVEGLQRIAAAGERRALVVDEGRVVGLLAYTPAAPWAWLLHRLLARVV